MQQRQPRLGDILDDYCPRERRVTNHAVVAMVGDAVKQTRCTTCDAEHEYKHAKVPRQRRKPETPAALYAQAAGGPKRVVHDPESPADAEPLSSPSTSNGNGVETPVDEPAPAAAPSQVAAAPDELREPEEGTDDAGPVHRPLIRATLPRTEGQPPPTRPAPEFTIRQPGGRQNRFRPRHQRGPQQFQGPRSNGDLGGGGPHRGGMPRPGGSGRPMTSRSGRKRSK